MATFCSSFALLCYMVAILLMNMFGASGAGPTGGGFQMDRNAFRMSFGKRSPPMETESNELNGANIAIPLMYDMAGAEMLAQRPLLPRHKVSAPWATRWRASLFSKRLDRNLYTIGFGRRRR